MTNVSFKKSKKITYYWNIHWYLLPSQSINVCHFVVVRVMYSHYIVSCIIHSCSHLLYSDHWPILRQVLDIDLSYYQFICSLPSVMTMVLRRLRCNPATPFLTLKRILKHDSFIFYYRDCQFRRFDFEAHHWQIISLYRLKYINKIRFRKTPPHLFLHFVCNIRSLILIY